MVGIGKSGNNVLHLNNPYVIRDDEAIDDNGEVSLLVRYVTVTAGGVCFSVLIADSARESLRDKLLGERLSPTKIECTHTTVEHLCRVACEIVVEVSAADNVVTLIILSLHIGKKHGHLRCTYLIATAVCRAVHVVDNELLATLGLDSRYAVASVAVKEL